MNNLYTQLCQQLPERWQADLERIANATIHLQTPLRVCVVGEFSAGKSSLLNALLETSILPTAREETTALPTFIEYAHTLSFELINIDQTVSILTQEQFASYTVAAPEQALCSVVNYPAIWLEDLSLIDLPGLGSQSQRHSEYTIAQISAADAIIYLLSPRGATQADLTTLRIIKNYGKHVLLAVAQWDTIEQSIQEGEQAPDLSQWQSHITHTTGLNLPLTGVSKYGHGRDTLIEFLQQLKSKRQLIRQQRMLAELIPLVTNALGQLGAEEAIALASSAEQMQQLQTELLSQKQHLLTLKSELYTRSHADQNQLEQHSLQLIAQHRQQLAEALIRIPIATVDDDGSEFTAAVQQQLQQQLLAVAQALTDMSADYGALALPDVEIKKFSLHLPPPEPLDLNYFLDNSRLSLLESELAKQQQLIAQAESKMDSLSTVDVQPDSALQQLQQLRAERDQIANQPLPTVIPTDEDSHQGAQLGRAIGQVLDIGLILYDGPLLIIKGLAMLGENAKAIKQVVPDKNSTMLNKLDFLEKISLSYWGEQLGKSFDLPVQPQIDPEAEAAQRQMLQEYDQKIALQQAELRHLETLQQERTYTGWALEQSLKEQQRLQESLQLLQTRAQTAQQEAEAEQQQRQQALRNSGCQQIITQGLQHFDQQTRPMILLLRATCKQYWQTQVDVVLADRLNAIDSLSQQLQQTPEQKQTMLNSLQQQRHALENVLATLHNSAVA